MMSPKASEKMVFFFVAWEGLSLWLTFFAAEKQRGFVVFVGLWHSCFCVYFFVGFANYMFLFFGGVMAWQQWTALKYWGENDLSINWIKATIR